MARKKKEKIDVSKNRLDELHKKVNETYLIFDKNSKRRETLYSRKLQEYRLAFYQSKY